MNDEDLIKKLDHEWGMVVHDANTEISKLLHVLRAAEVMLNAKVWPNSEAGVANVRYLRERIAAYRRFRESGGGELSRGR